MSTEIRVPDIGDFKNVEIIEVLVKEGDQTSIKMILSSLLKVINQVWKSPLPFLEQYLS